MKFHDIEKNNIENGLGIRTVLWVSGCYHNCPGCHNPMTHDPENGIQFEEEHMKELLDSLDSIDVKGLTISGGDGLCYYPVEVSEVIQAVRDRFGYTKDIWLYTGFRLSNLLENVMIKNDSDVRECFNTIIQNIDVLCDGRYQEYCSDVEYHWVGSRNQRVIDMKETLKQSKVVFLEKSEEEKYTLNNEYDNRLLNKYTTEFYTT